MRLLGVKDKTKRQRWISGLSLLILIFTLVLFAALTKEYFNGEFNSVQSFQSYIDQYGHLGPIILTVIQFIQVILPVLPGFLGCAVGSIMFGPLVGFLCNYIGISAGSIAAFLLARKFGAPLMVDLFPLEKYKKWTTWASRSKSYTAFLFVAMLLPLFPDDFFCYLTGLSKMSLRKFVLIIILGKPWCILAYSLGFSLIQ